MDLPKKAVLLRVFIGDSDRHHKLPLYEAIVLEARKRGLAGATVLHGVMGFGKSSRIHTAGVLRLSEDLPVIVEIVDTPERIQSFLPDLDRMINDGLVTVENVEVAIYRHRGEPV